MTLTLFGIAASLGMRPRRAVPGAAPYCRSSRRVAGDDGEAGTEPAPAPVPAPALARVASDVAGAFSGVAFRRSPLPCPLRCRRSTVSTAATATPSPLPLPAGLPLPLPPPPPPPPLGLPPREERGLARAEVSPKPSCTLFSRLRPWPLSRRRSCTSPGSASLRMRSIVGDRGECGCDDMPLPPPLPPPPPLRGRGLEAASRAANCCSRCACVMSVLALLVGIASERAGRSLGL